MKTLTPAQWRRGKTCRRHGIGAAATAARSRVMRRLSVSLAMLLVGACMAAPPAAAGDRLPATGGVTEFEGAGGGGLVPWALITGYGTRDQVGLSAFYTYVSIRNFRLQSGGLAVGLFDRAELSYAAQRFDLGSTVPGESILQDVFGAKFKLAGDAVFDQDRWWPQLAAGVLYKRNRNYDYVPAALGARHAADADFYLAATKLYLAGLAGRNVLLDLTLRDTRANQFGLLGFGGDRSDRRVMRFEGSLGVFLEDRLLVGAEYRARPDALSAFHEQSAGDLFLSWIPGRGGSLTLAWARFGRIADRPGQDGLYLSVQWSR